MSPPQVNASVSNCPMYNILLYNNQEILVYEAKQILYLSGLTIITGD